MRSVHRWWPVASLALVVLLALGLTFGWQRRDRSAAPDSDAAASVPTAPPSPVSTGEAARNERLVALARLWGAVKFFHPALASADIDWDAALVAALPSVEEAETDEALRVAYARLLAPLGDPVTRVLPPAGMPEAQARPAIGTLSVRRTGDGVFVVTARNHASLATLSEPARTTALRPLLDAAVRARAVVFDLRRADPAPAPPTEDPAASALHALLVEALPPLLDEDVPLSAPRRLKHTGYTLPGQRATGPYQSTFATTPRAVLPGRAERGTRPALVFLTDDATRGVFDVLGGLQAAGRATLVHQGDQTRTQDADAVTLPLPQGLVAVIRVGEQFHPNDTTGFQPNLVVPPRARGGRADAALTVARRIARGEQTVLAGERRPAAPAPAYPQEQSYPSMKSPERAYRLLALFRFWNVIDYFFPYKPLLDRPWEETLRRFIPRFEAAADEQAYVTAVAELVSAIQDTHGFISGGQVENYFGMAQPPLQVKTVEGQTAVIAIWDERTRAESGLAVGDVVLAVDGEEVELRRERLGRLLAASTPQALRWRVDRRLLTGVPGSEVRVRVRGPEGAVRDVTLIRAAAVGPPRGGPSFQVLAAGPGYIDLTRLLPEEVSAALEAVQDAPALILDMRGYPNGIFPTFAPRLARRTAVAARFAIREPEAAKSEDGRVVRLEQTVAPRGGWQYTGRVVVLINEEAISQSEHTCLWLEAAADVTFIGSPTSGANGNITSTVLPGGITAVFTGMEVLHGDGRQLQRIGILPHLPVEPTLAGLRAGRDEVLEAAIEFVNQHTR